MLFRALIAALALTGAAVAQEKSLLLERGGSDRLLQVDSPSIDVGLLLGGKKLQFGPQSVSGLALWLDASDASTITFGSGVQISNWKDKSGLGNNVAQSIGGFQPTLQTAGQNGKNTINFSTQSMNLNSTITAVTTGATVFMVASRASGGTITALAAASGFGYALRFLSVDHLYTSVKAGTYLDSGVTGLAAGSYNTLAGTIGAAGVGTGAIYINGTLSPSSSNLATVSDPIFYVIGQETSDIANGSIAELIYYSKVLSNYERGRVTAYLKYKWKTP